MPKSNDEEIKEEEVKEESTPQEETPVVEEKETPEEPTSEPKQEEPVEEFDLEEFKKATIKETSEAIVKKITEGLGFSKEEQDQAKDEGLIPPWEKENRNPKSYKEVAEFSADLAEWKRQQAEEARKEEAKQAEEVQKKTNDQWNKYWDEQIDELIADGKLPKVEDEKNENDPGKLARKALFQKMYEVAQQRLAEGKQPVTSLKEVFAFHYTPPDQQPAGYDAPVSLGKKAVSTGENKEYSYDEIHGKSFEKIITGSK